MKTLLSAIAILGLSLAGTASANGDCQGNCPEGGGDTTVTTSAIALASAVAVG